jgi:hypothetical protein
MSGESDLRVRNENLGINLRTGRGVGSVRALLAAIVAAMLLAACGTAIEAEPEGPAALEPSAVLALATTDAEGAPDARLDGATLDGPSTIVLDTPVEYAEVAFHLDDAASALHVERQAPYTLSLDVGALGAGSHVLEARVPHTKGRTRSIARATFEVVTSADEPVAEEPVDEEPVADEPVADDPSDPGDDGTTVVYGSPLVITSGGTYSGDWESTDSSVPAVDVRTSEPVVIENANIRSAGTLIRASWVNADLTIRNVHAEATYPTEAGRSAGRFLHVEGWQRIVVESSYLDGTSGIYLNASVEGAELRIVGNRALNIDGRKADGLGGYDGASYVQFLQVNDGRSLRASEVAWNEVVNQPFESRVEDVISLHATSGRAGDPVRVHDNYIQGAYPSDPVNDTFSGGGIMLGDLTGAYLHAYDNQVVATANYGIAISGGYENRIENNRVVACNVLPDGRPIASGNVGIYIWNIHGAADFAANVGYDNDVLYVRDGTRNDWWTPDAAAWSGNAHLDGGDVCEAERDEYAAWLGKVETAHATLAGTELR